MNIVPFNYEGKDIRTVTDDNGETMWVANDVAEVLGYKRPNDAINQHCKGAAKHRPLPTAGGLQKVRVIHEPDIYRMIANSQLEGAERFERWIFEEVLPTIRKTGKYETPQSKTALTLVPTNREFRAALSLAKLCGLKGNQALLAANKATKRITDVAPLQLLDISLPCEKQILQKTPTELGMMLGGISGQAINKRLVENGLQVKDATGAWKPTPAGENYAILLDTDKKHSNGAPIQQLKWLETVTWLLKVAA